MSENEIFIGNIKGAKGDTGSGLKIIDYYADEPSLKSAVLNPSAGDAYGVGSAYPYDIYIYSQSGVWVNNGPLQGAKAENEFGGFGAGTNATAESGGAIGKGSVTGIGGAVGENSNSGMGGAVGYGASESSGGGAVGNLAKSDGGGGSVGSSAYSLNGGAVGDGANTNSGGAVGFYANSTDGFAGGSNAMTTTGVAVGNSAMTSADGTPATLIDAIQLGTGNNSEAKTFKVYDYKLMNADGTIPDERMPTKAPAGHGLGSVASGTYDDSFNGIFTKGCGFYQIKKAEESPDGTGRWFPVVQISRGNVAGQELGAQMAFLDEGGSENIKMWMRTASLGVFSDWVEMLHAGNLTSKGIPKVINNSYVGTGTHGDSSWGDGCNQIALPSRPLLMIIRRNDIHTPNVIRFSASSTFWGEVNSTSEASGGCIAMKYDASSGVLKWYGDKYTWNFVADLSTGVVTTKVSECSTEDDILASNQLNTAGLTYLYTIFCE